ncbi:MAG: hypothetical protein GY769_17485 [bacterium]|nr:hypothetical protein [bacterium]
MRKKRSDMDTSPPFGITSLAAGPVILANLLILAFAIAAGLIESSNSRLYYALVQEDGTLEWMTFWAFFLAAVGFVIAARAQRRAGGGMPWLTLGLALFSVVVAMEEISWGQRVLGYRPPEYFLEQNFQQEFNVHNVFDTSLRKLALKTTILGFGVVLPLLALATPVKKLVRRFGPAIAPLGLIPAFAVTYWIYEEYPWKFSGEIVELMLGLGFLFAAVPPVGLAKLLPDGDSRRILAVFAVTAVLGFASFGYSRYATANDPERIETARAELGALAEDFTRRGRPISRCGTHKRVFSWGEKYSQLDRLSEGRFARLVDQGLPEPRAGYFIDPWNTAYWIRHKCSKSKRREIAFLYSFGPNRRRNSTDWELLEDDVGIVIFERGLD